jgi:ankyrin repeat protein
VTVSPLDLGQARKRAKELLRDARAGVAAAVERVGPSPRLADAQRATAIELGFASWTELKHEVEAERQSFDQRVQRFVEDATVGRLERARRRLERDPGISSAGVVPALLLGDTFRVAAELRRDAALPRVLLPPRNWTPLLYACHSCFCRDEARTRGLHETARLLLEAGADPNIAAPSPTWPGSMWTPLYGAAGVVHDAELTTLLLEAGANPDDGESVYHACESRDHTCLRILLDHGARLEGTNALAHMLDYDDLEGARLLLERGAGPGEGDAVHHAILRGRDARFIDLLYEHHADLERPNRDGITPYALAVRLNRVETAVHLVRLGAVPTAGPVDEFLAACRRGDAVAAGAAVAENPQLVGSLRADDVELLTESASWKDQAALRLLLDLGFPLDARGELDGTALHQAAWWGRAENVALLLERGASVHRGSWFGRDSTPLAWATHGSTACPDRDGDWLAVAELLVAAGADVGRGMLDDADDELAEWLDERLADHADA